MKINQHIIQGLFTSLILMVATVEVALNHLSTANFFFYFVFILAPYFILLGVIYPDTDTRKPWKIKMTGFFSFIWSFFKLVLAYPLRWLIYFPSFYTLKKLFPRYRFEDKHHGTTHTLLGIGVASTFVFLWSFFILFLIYKNSYSAAHALLSALIALSAFFGFLLGCLIHFVQDAYSGRGNPRYGIAPFRPFSNTNFFGDYSSFFDMKSKDRIMSFFIFLLMLLVPWSATFIYQRQANSVVASLIFLFFIISVLIVIYSSYGIEFNMRKQKLGRVYPLKKYFVRAIVSCVVLNLGLYIVFL